MTWEWWKTTCKLKNVLKSPIGQPLDNPVLVYLSAAHAPPMYLLQSLDSLSDPNFTWLVKLLIDRYVIMFPQDIFESADWRTSFSISTSWSSWEQFSTGLWLRDMFPPVCLTNFMHCFLVYFMSFVKCNSSLHTESPFPQHIKWSWSPQSTHLSCSSALT